MRREQDGPEMYQDPVGYQDPAGYQDYQDPVGYQDPGTYQSQTTPAAAPALETEDELWREPVPQRRERNGAYWTGLVVMTAGLVATVAGLATHVTSIVQTVLLAVPLVAIGLGIERVGRGVGRRSLRALGGMLIVVAVASPVVLSVSSPAGSYSSTASAPVPAGANAALLRTSEGGGQLRVDAGAVGLYQAELRTSGKPTADVSTSGKLAVVDLRVPAQHGLLSRNRGSDWSIRLNSSMPWRVQAEAGALTGDLDLRELDVRGVDVEAGISRLAVRLNQPSTRVPVSIRISTGLVDVYLPRSAACEVRVDGPALNNFSSQGLTNRDGAWRTGETGQPGSFQVSVRLSAGRVQVHRV